MGQNHAQLIEDAAIAVEMFSEDELEEYAEKQKLILKLVQDFKNFDPNATHSEVKEVFTRLHGFNLKELRLLVKGIVE